MAGRRPKVREDLTVLEVDQEAVVFDERSGDLHHLNPTAALVFGLLNGSATARELSADLAAAFRLPTAKMERAIKDLVAEFRDIGLLEGALPLAAADRPDAASHDHDHQHQHDHPSGDENAMDEREQIREEKPRST